MSVVPAGIIWDGKNQAWFTANAAVVFDANITIYCNEAPNYGQYKFTDGVTALGALPFIGGGSISLNPEEVVITDASGNLDTLSLGASQSIRRNAGNTAFEAYTPADTYTLQLVHAPTTVFTANSTWYWSNILNNTAAPRTNVGQQLISVPYNSTVIGACITCWSATGSISQTNSSIWLRVNGVDNVLTTALLWSSSAATARNHNITGLNIPLITTDTFEVKLTMGNLAQPPASSAVVSVVLYLQRN